MGNTDNHSPHLPKHYIAGVYIPQKGVWAGEFAATADELMSLSNNDLIGYRELELLEAMVDTQQLYEDWWRKTKKS